MKSYAPESKLLKALKALQATLLALTLVTMSFPISALAQTPDEPVVDIAPVVQQVVVDEPAPTDPAPILECEAPLVLNEDGTACVEETPVVETEEPVVEEEIVEVVVEEEPAPEVARIQQTVIPEYVPYDDDEEDGKCVVVSDNGTLVTTNDETNVAAKILTFVHSGWSHSLESTAKWIWGDNPVEDTTVDETQTFTKTFSVPVASPATLELASDNGYKIVLNGTEVTDQLGNTSNTFNPTTTYNVNLVAGTNTLVITVINKGTPDHSNDHTYNPAGLIYKLTATQTDCGEPVVNTCIAPDAGAAYIDWADLGEANVQEVLNGESYSINADTDQKNTQEWTATAQTVYFTVENLEDDLAGNRHIFGYLVNGGAFQPVFRDGSTVVPAYPGANQLAEDASTTFSVPGVNNIVFAIYDVPSGKVYATKKSLNDDATDHAIVYNPNDNEYVIAFEDLPNGGDDDYNDLFVSLHVDRCENGATCNAETELLANGSFENPSVFPTSDLWAIFPTGTSGLGWIATWLAGANTFGGDTRPEVANAELQKNGIISGWTAKAGNQWTELDSDWYGPTDSTSGEPGAVALTQTITTIPGKTYTFSFDFSPRPDQTTAAQNKVEATAGGLVIGTAGPTAGNGASTVWTSQSFSFVATTTTTVVGVRDAGTPSDSLGSFVDNAPLRCTPRVETKEEVTIVASKIVCTNEAELPNWGNGESGPITQSTASAWVASHTSCSLVDGWSFEVADETGGDLGGDFVGNAGAPYVPFGPTVAGVATTTVSTDDVDAFHLREVLKDGYIPFTYDQQNKVNTDIVSAEFYCGSDVLNYDNLDYIDNPVDGATYYCVAWNVPKPGQCNPSAQTVILSSDGFTYDQLGVASIVASVHEAWVDAIDALWIWKDVSTSVPDADLGTTEVFTRQFSISGVPLDASLDIASDNYTEVKVNGVVLTVNPETEFNYAATTTYAIPAALMQSGLNTITFKVTNLNHATANTPGNNPGGLLYKLTTGDNQCAPPVVETVKVHIYKYLKDANGGVAQVPNATTTVPSFPMITTYSAANIGSGTNAPYVLGNYHGQDALKYAADTSAMSLGADYTTSEVTDGSVVIPAAGECVANKYRLVGYKSGDSLAEAEAAAVSVTAPVFNDLTNDKYQIVVNEDCDDVLDDGGGNDDEFGTLIIEKYSEGATGVFSVTVNPADDQDSFPVSLNTEEDGFDSESGELLTGTYDITETVPEGWTLQSVTCDYDDYYEQQVSDGNSIPNGKTIYLEEGDTVTCTFVNTKDGEETNTSETVVVTDNALNGWALFNYDNSNGNDNSNPTVSGTDGSFVFGPTGQPLGAGSFEQVTGTDGNDATRLRTSQFNGVALTDLEGLSYETYVAANGGAQATYVQIRIDRDANGTWDDALFFEPVYQNGGYSMLYGQPNVPNQCGANPNCVSLNEWQSWDLDAGGWWSNLDSAGGPPLTTIAAYAAQYPGAVLATDTDSVRMQAGFGAPVWDNFKGNFDKFVIAVKTGTNTHTTTFDFEPVTETPITPQDERDGRQSRSGSSSGNNGDGEVLGASSCSALLTDYLKIDWANDPEQVKLLQNFLNNQVGTSLPLSGFFGPATFEAVKLFQQNYWEQVLKPWFSDPTSGITSVSTPTGFVYQTTRWQINNIFCPGSEGFPSDLN